MNYRKLAIVLSGISFISLNLLISTLYMSKEQEVELLFNDVISGGFAQSRMDGYKFTIKSTKTGFTMNVDPIIPGVTGDRHFFTSETGVIRWSIRGPANQESPILQNSPVLLLFVGFGRTAGPPP